MACTVDLVTAAVVHLDFFTWLAKNPTSAAAISAHFGLRGSTHGCHLTLFTANGFIESRNGIFHVTELGLEHLTADSPWNLAPYYASLKDRPVVRDFLTVLTSDKPANWGSAKDALDWHKAVMETEAFANSFTAAIYADRKLLRGGIRWLKKGENARTRNAGVPRPAAAMCSDYCPGSKPASSKRL